MSRIRVGTTIGAPPDAVWAAIRDVGTHTTWMRDAEAIRHVGGRPNRVGARYEVDTRVGPFSLLDVMEVTEWDDARVMGVRHVGLVTGTGRFTLLRRPRGRTRFTWEESLTFPWWMGGPLGALVGGRALRLVWRRNLATLKDLVEGSGRPARRRRGAAG